MEMGALTVNVTVGCRGLMSRNEDNHGDTEGEREDEHPQKKKNEKRKEKENKN